MNSVDPRTPVLVGTGQLIQKPDNPVDALEPLAMMRVALEAAADDAGARSLLDRATDCLLYTSDAADE